jgi:phage host-nuclease inhibitor protein Gam
MGPGQARSTDPNVVDAALVRAALAAFSQYQAEARKELNERLDGISREIKAVGTLLTARVDALDEHVTGRLDTLASEAKTIAHAVDEHTSQLKEMLHFANQTYDVSVSAARKTELICKRLGIPDELDAQAENESNQDRTSTEGNESDRPPGSVRR